MRVIKISGISTDGLIKIAEIYLHEIYSLKDMLDNMYLPSGSRIGLEQDLINLQNEYMRLEQYINK